MIFMRINRPNFTPFPTDEGLGSVVTVNYELCATNSLYSLQPAIMIKILILAFAFVMLIM